MKLISIKIFASGQLGWQSDLLEFGENITHLFGPNGCGKTPIVQSIVFCLGYPSVFRNDIYENCAYVELKVETGKGCLTIKREYSRDVDIEVVEPSGNLQRFFDEKEYSTYLFEWMGMQTSNLVTNSNKVTAPYLATMIPIFYLDQDEGYSGIYCPPNNFIKDQFSEMMRMIFGLPEKNSFDKKKERIEAKERLDYLDHVVEKHSRQVNAANETASAISKSSGDLTVGIQTLESEMEQLKGSGASHDDSIGVIDRLISSHHALMRDVSSEIAEINKRSNSIGQIINEIETEINTLNLNEEARRIFLSFDEICGSGNCQLFSRSSESYSKNLLYLKDQIKDLERNTEIDAIKAEQLKREKSHLEVQIKTAVDERNKTIEKSEISALVDAISALKNQIFELQSQRSEVEKAEKLKTRHYELLSQREEALSRYQSFSTDGVSIPELIYLRADLRKYFLEWLDKLHTSNISRDITFKDDFVPILGQESISQLKGSTRVRAVLAYHAAVLELMAQHGSSGFGFLVMDTPKQHEIHNDDLDRYVQALKALSAKHGMQVIFSTTEYHYQGDEFDKEWNPKYPGEEQKMFLTDKLDLHTGLEFGKLIGSGSGKSIGSENQ